MAAHIGFTHRRRMHWRSRSAIAKAAASVRYHQITGQVRDFKWQRNPCQSMPDHSVRHCIYQLLTAATMQRHEFRQTNWDTAKHHKKGWLGLLAIVLAYCLVGALEHV